MKGTEVIKKTLLQFSENELIFASKLYYEELSELVSEMSYYKTLERMTKSGELAKASRGVYYKPRISKYGVVPLSKKDIVSAFTQNNQGMEIGYTLYNRLNLTTQVSKNVTILSSVIDGATKSIGNVTVEYNELEFSKPVTELVSALEVFNNFYSIEDINYTAFLNFTQNFAETFNAEIFDMVYRNIKYPKSTIAFAEEVLNYYNIYNNLKKYLSALSNYKYPRMEYLNEVARI